MLFVIPLIVSQLILGTEQADENQYSQIRILTISIATIFIFTAGLYIFDSSVTFPELLLGGLLGLITFFMQESLNYYREKS